MTRNTKRTHSRAGAKQLGHDQLVRQEQDRLDYEESMEDACLHCGSFDFAWGSYTETSHGGYWICNKCGEETQT